jgi:hypothetical protein
MTDQILGHPAPELGPLAQWRRKHYSWSDTGRLIHGVMDRFKFMGPRFGSLRWSLEDTEPLSAVENQILIELENLYQQDGLTTQYEDIL